MDERSRVVIDDEMVRRCRVAWSQNAHEQTEVAIRAMLEVALNPPTVPEVEVTDAMKSIGASVLWDALADVPLMSPGLSEHLAVGVYRTMHAARPADTCKKPLGQHAEGEQDGAMKVIFKF